MVGFWYMQLLYVLTVHDLVVC